MRLDDSPREMVELAQRGDRAAFTRLVNRYERAALGMAYSILGDANSAGDAAQEAFLRAWQRLGDLDDPGRFGPWLGRIVRNLSTDLLRRRPPTRQLSDDLPDSADPAATMNQSERSGQINTALARLDELTRSAIVLRYYENLSSKQIAELLEMSPAAVDMRLSRGREQLRGFLDGMREGKAVRGDGVGSDGVAAKQVTNDQRPADPELTTNNW